MAQQALAAATEGGLRGRAAPQRFSTGPCGGESPRRLGYQSESDTSRREAPWDARSDASARTAAVQSLRTIASEELDGALISHGVLKFLAEYRCRLVSDSDTPTRAAMTKSSTATVKAAATQTFCALACVEGRMMLIRLTLAD